MTQFYMPLNTFMHVVPVQTFQRLFPADSSDSSLPQRTSLLDLNAALFYRGLGPHVLCHKKMMRAGAYHVQVKLSCPLWLLSQWEEMVVVELPCHLEATEVAIVELLAQYEEITVADLPCPLEVIEVAIAELLAQYEEVVVAELPCPLKATEVAVAELLAQYNEMTIVELLVEQEWQVHVPQVMTSVFELIVYAASVVISAHLRKFCVGYII
jgi:hypothetical protein